MKKQLRTQKGSGLLEVLVALSLFAVVASGLAVTTVGSIHGNETSRMISTASSLVHDKIEELRSLDSETVPLPVALQAGTHTDANNPMTGTGAAAGAFVRQWTVTANTPRRNIARIEVSVTWEGATAPVLGVTYVCTDSICG
jgi:type II secretory pathway pseudopilin PulG